MSGTNVPSLASIYTTLFQQLRYAHAHAHLYPPRALSFRPTFLSPLGRWEHDEMADSLLHGGGGRLRRVPSSNLQHRYKSSENLSRSSKSVENLTRSSKSVESLDRSSRSAENLSQSGGGGGGGDGGGGGGGGGAGGGENDSVGTLAATEEGLASPSAGGGSGASAPVEGAAAGTVRITWIAWREQSWR